METAKSKLKAAVLSGGPSSEREVSLQSGGAIAAALKKAGVDVISSDISPDDLSVLDDESIDIFFIALHGTFGEDGQLQQILEDRELIYTGCGPAVSELAFDKVASKKVFAEAGINTPAGVEFDSDTDIKRLREQLQKLADKYVIKPVREGSSVGISIVDDCDEAIAIAGRTLDEFGDCMIEEFIAGREITVGILRDKALPIVEVRTQNGFYDYEAKYLDEKTEYLFDTIKDPKLVESARKAALECFDALGCRGFARVDFRLSDEQGLFVLEVNTIPGFTSHSLLPMAAAKAGISMSELCVEIIEVAMANKESLIVDSVDYFDDAQYK